MKRSKRKLPIWPMILISCDVEDKLILNLDHLHYFTLSRLGKYEIRQMDFTHEPNSVSPT